MPVGWNPPYLGPMLNRALTFPQKNRQCGLSTKAIDYPSCNVQSYTLKLNIRYLIPDG